MAAADEIINVRHFIEATRDSGYKSTTSAIAELVDNSIQAGAKTVTIDVCASGDPDHPMTVIVADDGVGMATADLRRALQFGGSSRFGDRDGLGRYGMGLPNASLSQCRRVEVISWTSRRNPLQCWIDVDEIARGRMRSLPKPVRAEIPESIAWESGTVVVWHRCDRLDNVRISTIERKVAAAVGRMFRHYIWSGVRIQINGKSIPGLDPLFLHPESPATGGVPHGSERRVRVRPTPDSKQVGIVRIRFARLPVHEWSEFSNEKKRAMGLANGAGVSVVRGGREIEYGWHFTGSKRRENYDDWWRCEVAFDPILDEAFGITHTKQQIRPRDHLLEALVPEVETMAKSLNAAVRKDFQQIKTTQDQQPLTTALAGIEPKLPVIKPRHPDVLDAGALESLRRSNASLRTPAPPQNGRVQEYQLVDGTRGSKALFDVHSDEGRVVIALNKKHPYLKSLYSREDNETITVREAKQLLEEMIASAARAELVHHKKAEAETIQAFRETWGRTLELLSNGK